MSEVVAAGLVPLRRTLHVPVRTARGTLRARDGWLLALRDAAGRTGWGEATPLPAHGTESAEACERALRRVCARARGVPVPPRPGPLPLELGSRAARFAFESALFDLAAQRASMPLARWLDAASVDAVPVNALLRSAAPDALAAEAAECAAAGFHVLKLKVGAESAARDAERVAAVRAAVGPAAAIRLDANAGLSETGALALLAAVAPSAPEYVEEPLAAPSADAWRRLYRATGVALAADESADGVAACRSRLGERAVHVLVLKPLVLGGLLRTREIARLAAEARVGVVVTGALDGAVATWACAHVAASLGPSVRAAGLATASALDRDAFPPPRIEAGRLALEQRPGLGLGAAAPAPVPLAEARL